MRAFGKLPSSPDLKDMNDLQWIWCFLNIVEDEKEDDDLYKARAKYSGLFINPEGVRAVAKAEQKRKTKQNGKSSIQDSENDIEYNDDDSDKPVYVSNTFDEEMKKVLQEVGEDFIELPEPEGQRGDSSMSSNEFISFMSENFDKFNELQEHVELKKTAHEQIDDDLDIIEID